MGTWETHRRWWNAFAAGVVLGIAALAVRAAAADSPGHAVRGLVQRDPYCDPQSSITVWLQPTERRTVVDAGGAFEFSDVADGDYVALAESECQPSEYDTDAVYVRGTDAYTELHWSQCPQRVVATVGDGLLRIVGRCYVIHSGRAANVYIDEQLVGSVRGETAGDYETTIDVTHLPPGRHFILIAVPGPILGVQVGAGLFRIEEQPCPGDCNGDGRVVVGELVLGVRLALGEPGDPCPALYVSGPIDIHELVSASTALLNGCP
jgi:hypothetical protein